MKVYIPNLASGPRPTLISGGWSICQVYTSESDKLKQSPIYSGTPRVLPIIANLLGSRPASFISSLVPSAPSSLVNYYVLERPELYETTEFWKADTFIGSNDVIPGLSTISVKAIETFPVFKVLLSSISITTIFDLNLFEEQLLFDIRDSFLDEYPQLIEFDGDPSQFTPTVKDRRLHFGFHNSYEFISAPTSVTLTTQVSRR